LSHSPINRRDALLAAGLAITVTAPSSALAQTPPQPTTASAILKSQSLAPLIGAPVELGRASNGPIVNQAAGRTQLSRSSRPHRQMDSAADGLTHQSADRQEGV